MSQDLYFYKQKIIPEKIAQSFTTEEIHSSIKALLKNRDLEEEENLHNVLFEEIEVFSISISSYDKKFEELLKDTEFIPLQSRRFMMNNKFMSTIETIVSSKISELENARNSQKKTKQNTSILSKEISQLKRDLSKLEKLFNKNLLFVNLQ